MMPILDLQRRLREAGRIRIGEKVTKNGKTYPSKLTTFRFTSRDRDVIDAAAVLFQGQVKPWLAADGTDQWEVITKTDRIEVVVPPADMAFSQFYELWSGGGCQRRCDGAHELIGDQLCVCDPETRECTPHSRLSLIIPDLPVVGLFRLDTSGWNAATELAGSVDLARAFAARGTYLPAELRLEQREKRKPGEATKKFVVPILDLKVSMRQIGALAGAAPEANGERALPAFTPVPEDLTPVPVASIADQLAPRQRVPRSNAAEPIPPTGVAVKGRGESGPVDVGEHPAGPVTSSGGGRSSDAGLAGAVPDIAVPPTPDDDQTLQRSRQVVLWCKEIDPTDEWRHHFLEAFSEGAYSSSKLVPADGDVIARLRKTLVEVKRGTTTLSERDGRWLFTFGSLPFESTDPAGEHRQRDVIDVEPLAFDVVDADYWRRAIDGVTGVGVTTLVKQARSLAGSVGVEPPSGLDTMSDPRLVAVLKAWLDEKRAG